MRRIAVLLIVSLLLPTVLTFGVGVKEETVALRFSWWGGDARHKATLDVINQYMAKNPSVRIEAEYQGYDGYFEKLTTQLAGGTEPDLIQAGQNSLLQFKSKFVDLYGKKSILDISGFDKNILDSFCVQDGKLLGLPTGLNGITLIYNKDLLAKAGIPVDTKWDWNNLIEYGRKLHSVDNKYYLLSCDTEQLQYLLDIYVKQSTGRQWINDDYTMGFTRDSWIKALQYEKTLFDNNVLQPYVESIVFEKQNTQNPKVINGEFGLLLSDASVIQSFKTGIKFSMGVTCPPLASDAKDSGIVVQPAQVLAVSAGSKKIDDTVKFLNWFFKSDEAIMALTTVRGIPTTIKGRKLLSDTGKADADIAKAIEIDLQHPGKPPSNQIGGAEELFSVLLNTIQEVGFGKSTPEAAADAMIQKYEEILKELKAQSMKQ